MASDRKVRQVVPVGRLLPIVVHCVPNRMTSAPPSGFQTTRWTLIQAAAVNPSVDSHRALSMLCQAYWHPVYAFIRRNGYAPESSQDLTQGFFALLLEKNYLVHADQKRGRFRSFLLASVKHFLANEWDRANALKRGGGQTTVSMDLIEAERWYVPAAGDASTPEKTYERQWALSILEQVMSRLRADYANAGKADQFELLSQFLNPDSPDVGYEELAGEMSMSAGALRMAVHRMRRAYRRVLREKIGETVSTPDEIDAEIQYLIATLSK
jgi:DNA-directed RNA polymerase specialized sigma24 family protein